MLARTPMLLRAEAMAGALLALVLYGEVGVSWWLLAVLALAPELSMLGYLAGPRVGAAAYNAAHALIGPSLLALIGVLGESDVVTAIALIWFVHIAIDRTLRYGLKEPTGFHDTHLGTVGKERSPVPGG